MKDYSVQAIVHFAIRDNRTIWRAAIAGAALAAMGMMLHGAHAAETAAPRCMDLAKMKSLVSAHGAKWIDLTHDQFEFMRAISVMSPHTVDGLPFGDKAALARSAAEGGSSSMIVFLDGERACDAMPVPQVLVDMLNEVAEVKHEPPQGVDQ